MKVALSIVAVLLAVDLVRANVLVYSNPCSAVDQKYPYPNDNTKYIHCTSATTFEAMSCGAGTVWDQIQQGCEHPPTSPTPPPVGIVCNVGAFSEDACELNVFYQCAHTVDGAGKWVKFLCPATTVYYQANNTCIHSWENTRTPVCPETTTSAPVVPTVPNCVGVAHGAFLPDLCNYSTFYQCSYGTTVTYTCTIGLEFDRTYNVCNWPAAAKNPPRPATCP